MRRGPEGTSAVNAAARTDPCAGLCDPAGFRAAYATHSGQLLGYCARELGDRGLAEEIVQETFVRAWRNCSAYRGSSGSLRTWLYAIARNAMIDAMRARAVRPQLTRADPVEEAGPDDSARMLVRLDVERALASIAPEHRDAVVRVFLWDRSYEQTAAELGIPVGTVKSRVFYGLRALRAAMPVGAAAETG